MIRVFLSHASQDKPFVRELAEYLERDGEIKAWIDEAEIHPGKNIVQKIGQGLEADFLLLILTPHSVQSNWVREEWTDAFYEQTNQERTKLACVLYRECQVPHLLRTQQRFDLRTNQLEGFRKVRTWLLDQRPVRPQPFHAPARPPLFIGREAELQSLREQLQSPGALVHVQGMPGKGKTTLALEFAHRHRQDFEAVYWLACQSGNLAQIAGELATQLGLKLEGDTERNTRDLRDLLSRKRCLLVLDSVEEEGPEQLIPNGSASVLVTTRRPHLKFLHFRKPTPLPLFTEEECFQLFRQVVGDRDVDRHEAACRQFFQRLEFLPIAIAVAAGLIRYDVRFTIRRIAETLPANVTELIDTAVASLPSDAQCLLSAMAACAPEGFRFDLAAHVAGLAADPSLDGLQELLSRSLVEELDRTDRRYRLHALLRKVAGTRNHYAPRHVEVLNQQFEKWESDWRTCVVDLPDYMLALRWAIGDQSREPASFVQELADFGYRLASRTGRSAEAFEICASMLILAERTQDRARLQAWLGNQALILQAWGRLEEAMALHKQKEAICHELGDRSGQQVSYGNQALILKEWGQREEAMALLKQQEAICQEIGDRSGLQASYGNQALILKEWGRLDEAMDLHKQEEAICQELGDRSGLASGQGNMALILRQQGRLPESRALAGAALATFRELRMPRETEQAQQLFDSLSSEEPKT